MQLKEFVTETFKQIVDGIIEAQAHAGPKGARINPPNLTARTDQGFQLWDNRNGQIATQIEFDVALTTSEGTGTKGGIGLFVGPVGVGSQGQSDSGKSSNSRIKFTVPVFLPSHGRSERADD